MDISLGTLALAVLSFVVGTLSPLIYRRISFEGFSIQQPFDSDLTIGDSERDEYFYVTIVKIANAQNSTALIDSIELESSTKSAPREPLKGIKLKIINPGDAIVAPITANPEREEFNPEGVFASADKKGIYIRMINYALSLYLPIIIKANEEVLLAIQFSLTNSFMADVFDENANAAKPMKLMFRVNGKYRNYPVFLRGKTVGSAFRTRPKEMG